MTHTPGPWHWDSDPIKGDPLGRVRYRVTALGRTITQCYYSSDNSGQAEADARLIAAAPAMADEIVALKAKLAKCEESLRAFDLRDEAAYWESPEKECDRCGEHFPAHSVHYCGLRPRP